MNCVGIITVDSNKNKAKVIKSHVKQYHLLKYAYYQLQLLLIMVWKNTI